MDRNTQDRGLSVDPEPEMIWPKPQGVGADDEEAREDAEDARIGRERLRLAKVEGTVSWESVKAKYGL